MPARIAARYTVQLADLKSAALSPSSMPPPRSKKPAAFKPSRPRSSLAFDPTLLEDDDDVDSPSRNHTTVMRGSVMVEGGRRRSSRLSNASQASESPTPPTLLHSMSPPTTTTTSRKRRGSTTTTSRPSKAKPKTTTSRRAKDVGADETPKASSSTQNDLDDDQTGGLGFKFSTIPYTTPKAPSRQRGPDDSAHQQHRHDDGHGEDNDQVRLHVSGLSTQPPVQRGKRKAGVGATTTAAASSVPLEPAPKRVKQLDAQTPQVSHHDDPVAGAAHRVALGLSNPGSSGGASQSIHVYGKPEWTHDTLSTLPTAETPMQVKNQRLRRGDDVIDHDNDYDHDYAISTLSTHLFRPSSTVGRRVSMDRRGGRGSSIGTGFDALPHPSLTSSELYRHIRPDQPPPVRLRTLLSWCSQRLQQQRSLASPSQSHSSTTTTGRSTRQDPKSKGLVDDLVQQAIASFVKGVCERKVDVSWYGAPPSIPSSANVGLETEAQAQSSSSSLPPHPQNVRNEEKMKQLDAWEQRMVNEDAARQRILARYRDVSIALETARSRPLAPTVTSRTLCYNLPPDSSKGENISPDVTDWSDLSSIISYGRLLRSNPPPHAQWAQDEPPISQGEDETQVKGRRKSRSRSTRRSSVVAVTIVEEGDEIEGKQAGEAEAEAGQRMLVKDGDTVEVDRLVGMDWSDLRSGIATLASQVHRLDQTCRLIQSLTASRLASSHALLTSLGNSSNTSPSTSTQLHQGRTPIMTFSATSTVPTTTPGTASATATATAKVVMGRKRDARDVLRAIAKEDSKKRHA